MNFGIGKGIDLYNGNGEGNDNPIGIAGRILGAIKLDKGAGGGNCLIGIWFAYPFETFYKFEKNKIILI